MMEYKIYSLPRRPDLLYDEWNNWSEWLGCISPSDKNYAKFNEAVEIVNKI